MKSRMPTDAYISQDWFLRERALLFKPLWQFVTLTALLGCHNAFVARTLCGVPIVVQNFDGDLRAFENLCAHRQNPLQSDPQGVRPLVCRYHGWGYGTDGKVNNIPFEAQVFRFSKTERGCLGLQRFAVEVIGGLVFVNLSPEPRPITEQFNSDLIESLRASSDAFDTEVLLTTYSMRCNWKLAYENLRDSHHPRYLHSQSLFQNVKFQVQMDEAAIAESKAFQQQGLEDVEQTIQMLRTFSNGGLNEPMTVTPYSWHDNVGRYGNVDWYYNWLVFPNLHIASGSGGYSFIIEHHVPVSAAQTDLIVHYVTAKKKRKYSTSAAVLHAHIMGADPVLREDIDVMERIQANLYAGAPQAQLGDYEHANATIERWYLDVMEGKVAL